MGNRALIAAHIYASSWALEAPGLPKSPHQIRSLGLSVNTKQGRDGHSTWVNTDKRRKVNRWVGWKLNFFHRRMIG